MRIRDWSSDVCASDRVICQGMAHIVRSIQGPRGRGARARTPTQASTAANVANAAHFEVSKWPSVLLLLATIISTSATGAILPDRHNHIPVRSVVVEAMFFVLELYFELVRKEFTEEIGRASCRERVCQYGEI